MIKLRHFVFAMMLMPFVMEAAPTIWTKKSNFPGVARHRTTGFTLGNKGYVGLGHYNSGPLGNVHLEDFWEYDPSTDSWTQVADFGGGKRYHSADFVKDGKAYVFGGRIEGGILTNDLWMYDPIANSWTAKASCPGWNRRGAVGFTLGQYGFIGCGQLQGGPTFYGRDFWAYHFATDTWYSAPELPGAYRTSSTAFVIDGNAYVGTGNGWNGTSYLALRDFWRLDSTTWTWTAMPDVGDIPRVEAYGFALNGYGYILCGASWSSGTNYSDMYRFDPTTNTWDSIPEFPALGRRYLDGFEIGDNAYMCMGTNGTNFKDLWAFNPDNAASTEELEISAKVFPNPASDVLRMNIGNSSPEGLSLNIYDLNGRLMVSNQLNSVQTEIDVADFDNGTYIYVISDGSQNLSSNKFVVSH